MEMVFPCAPRASVCAHKLPRILELEGMAPGAGITVRPSVLGTAETYQSLGPPGATGVNHQPAGEGGGGCT